VGLLLFDQPWDQRSRPRTISVIANWTPPDQQTRAPAGTTYPLEEYPLARVIGSREPVFVRDFQEDKQIDLNARGYFINVLKARSAIVLPLVVGNQTLGGIVALSEGEIQLTDPDIRQAITLSEQAASVIQSFLLNEKTQATLAELEATQRRYQIQAWSSYNQSRRSSGIQKTGEGFQPLSKQPIAEVKTVLNQPVPLINDNGEALTLTVPIMLRDQPIGAIGLQADENKRQWTPEEVALVQEITEQFALAAESLRLLDETQRRAARERLVGEITTKLRTTNDPQTMLETAAAELRAALKAKRTQVLIQPHPANETNPQPGENKRGEQ
jgi:GAF domain-containing protein